MHPYLRAVVFLTLVGCTPSVPTEVAGTERGRVSSLKFPLATTNAAVEAGSTPVLLGVNKDGHLWVRQNGGTNLVRYGADGSKQATYALGPSGPKTLAIPPTGLPRALVDAANAPSSGVLRPGWSRTEAASFQTWGRMTDAGKFEDGPFLETPSQVQPDGSGGVWALWDQADTMTGALNLWMAHLGADGSATAVRKVKVDGLARTGYAPIGGDRAGNLWVVYKFEDGHKIERFTPDGKRTGELGFGSELRSVSSAVEDGEGNVWLQYKGGGKLIVIRPNGTRVGQVTPEFGPSSIQGSAGGAIWAYTLGRPRENGSLVRFQKDGTAKEKITSPYEDYGFLDWAAGPDGSLWVLDKPAEQLIRMSP